MDIQRIKEYNNLCNQYKKKASDIQAEINYCKNALEDLCKTLTEQLGIMVTPDNLKQIYEEREAKTANTIISGTAIMENIKRAERGELKQEVKVETKTVASNYVSRETLKSPVDGMYGFGGSSEEDSGEELIVESDVAEEESQLLKETLDEFSGVAKTVQAASEVRLDSIDPEKPKPTLNGFKSPFDDDDEDVTSLPKSSYKMPQSFVNMASGLGEGLYGNTGNKVEQI